MGQGRFKCGFISIFLIASIAFGVILFIDGAWLLDGVIDFSNYFTVPIKWYLFPIVAMLAGVAQAVLSIIALVKTWEWKMVMIFHIVIAALCVVVIVLYIMTHDSSFGGRSDNRSTTVLVFSIFDIIFIVVCIILKMAVFK